MKIVASVFLIAIMVLFSTFAAPPASWLFSSWPPKGYEIAIDKKVHYSGNAAAWLRCSAGTSDGQGILYQVASPANYLGRRVRLTAWIKVDDLSDRAQLWCRAFGSGGLLSFDNMDRHPIRTTVDWKKYESVIDVPLTAVTLEYGVTLRGTGNVWLDEVALEIVDKQVPLTDPESNQMTATHPTNLGFEE